MFHFLWILCNNNYFKIRKYMFVTYVNFQYINFVFVWFSVKKVLLMDVFIIVIHEMFYAVLLLKHFNFQIQFVRSIFNIIIVIFCIDRLI